MIHDTEHPADPRIDPVIDRTLAALRDAQPRAGVDAMNRRLLAGLQQHQAQHQAATPGHPQRPLFPWRFYDLRLPAAAALLITITCVLFFNHPHPIATNQPNAQPQPAAIISTVQATTTTSVLTPARIRVPHISILRCGPTTTPSCAPLAATTPHPTEQALLNDLHAPSQPAPRMPLTRDERLLLRAASHSEQIELARLEALPRPAPRNPSIAEYVHRMLAPLVAAESIEPTPANDTSDNAPPNN